ALLQEDPGALDFLAAQGAQETRNQAIHQLEIRRQRRRRLVRVVEDLLVEAFRVQRRAAAAVDEDEPAVEAETLALLIRANRHDPAAAERIVDFLFALDDLVALQRREEYGAGHDERLLIFLTDPLPVLDVREDVLVRLQVFLFLDLRRRGRGCAATTTAVAIAAFGRDILQREYIGVDDAQLRLRPQLAAKQPRGFQVSVHVLGAARDEAGDEHALKCRHIQLRADGRLDRDLERVSAGDRHQHRGETTEQTNASCDH